MRAVFITLIFASFFWVGCGPAGEDSLLFNEAVSDEKQVKIFDKTHIYAGKGGGRIKSKQVNLPVFDGRYDTAFINLNLSCPLNSAGMKDCDYWDRKGQITLQGVHDGDPVTIELMRFMTPYGVGSTHNLDISDLLPVLAGSKKISVFIDTWVKPGHPQGEGWLVDLRVTYSYRGKNKKVPVAVRQVVAPMAVPYGKPGYNLRKGTALKQLPPHSSARLWSYVTGHGQNVGAGANNCAEFCDKIHTFGVRKAVMRKSIWRDDCAETKTDGIQRGTWTLSRAGWCPGDKVRPIKVNYNISLGSSGQVFWAPESWVNLDDGDYNNGNHTRPYFEVSSFLVLFE